MKNSLNSVSTCLKVVDTHRAAMGIPIQEPGIHVNRQRGESHDAQAIFQNRERNNDNAKNQPFPRSSQEEMACQNRCNQECKAKTYATTFFGHAN